MNSLIREWRNTSRSDVFRIIPLGDIHLGARACDEKRLKETIEYIRVSPKTYWVGLGDYCEFINVNDRKRFNPGCLAPWLTMCEMGDLAKAEINHFVELVSPIADKCLGLVCGNHEAAIHQYTERDVYSEIVTRIKEAGKFPAEHKLAIGYYGWLLLRFSAKSKGRQTGHLSEPGGTRTFVVNLHHGFVGGGLAGAKALAMDRHLWTHDCDITIFGHSHNTSIQSVAVQGVDGNGNVRETMRRGCYAGTYLQSNIDGATMYSEVKGYLPLPIAGVQIELRPRALKREDAIRISA